ncbi:DEAD/DEAH box helicase [Bacteroidales bacterium OttesenSCG-928-B11]|nr:DEAD/DEAH box helicase [Bacteroidales bacterium OttesenSCG-928-E04]MDL2309049.1 DEAD/DEAH box helicase [Bacteroidales bacterium OttesenSCG-928-C03]MDL2312267.1 DEAD/DEAH box helicase [Bacteroidales bacterium OttesenSCG-928-B11]
MKRDESIQFFNSLNADDQLLLKIAIIKTYNLEYSHLEARMKNLGRSMTQTVIKKRVRLFEEHKIIRNSRYGYQKIEIDNLFFVHILPHIEDAKKLIDTEAKLGSSYYYYHEANPLKRQRSMLIALLFEDIDKYRVAENEFLDFSFSYAQGIFREILNDDSYAPYFHKISPWLTRHLINTKILEDQYHFIPFSETEKFLERMNPFIIDNNVLIEYEKWKYYYSGNIEKAIGIPLNEEENLFHTYYLPALKLLMEEQVEDSLKIFEKGLKSQRKEMKGSYLPYELSMSFFYMTALLRMESTVSLPVFQRIAKSLNPDEFLPHIVFETLIRFFTEGNSNLENNQLQLGILFIQKNIFGILALLTYYLCNFKLSSSSEFEVLYNLVDHADNAGYSLLALEAAYALNKLLDNPRSTKLYERIAAKVDHAPFISKIVQVEEWEKTLDLLLGIQPKSSKKNTKEASSRIVYYFNPRHNSIQPVLQTRQVKGWSKGRNIAMKTFFEGGVQNMSDQDFRISKTISFYSSYYQQEYQFKDSVFKELIGHPHIFLDGGVDTPVEFMEGKPVITVEQSGTHYLLKTNFRSNIDDSRLFIEKETNTRYHIYDLTNKQRDILRIILKKQLSVPKSGKEKLIKLLATLSEQNFDIHSDLFASENSETEIESVAADSRIRVQLLPFGDGLKAELYSKPFGEFPPYCKPGKGGKVLIRNGENTQYQVKRDMAMELAHESQLMDDIQGLESLDIQDGLIAFNDPMDSLYMLDIIKHHSNISVVEWPEGEKFKITGSAGFENLKLSLKTKNNWFDLQGELVVDENTILSLQQLLSLTEKSHGRFIELSDGQFLALTNELKKQLDDLRSFSTSDKKNVAINPFASVALEGFFENVKNLKTDKDWKAFQKRVHDTKMDEVEIPSTLQAELRPYQEEGFRWMTRLAQWNAGACLADDMGLGKTIQSLAVLLHRANQGAALVVCPVSVMGNWINEINRFAPSLNVKTLANANREETLNELQAGDVLITSYGLVQSEDKLFGKPEFGTIILDEAHAIKNFNTKTSKAIMQLKGLFRIALTGTPIQNHLGEIWNLFNFINPGLLGNLTQFTDRFIKPGDEAMRKRLKKLIAPFILRRTKTTVLEELPSKTEIVKKIQLSEMEMAFYEVLRREALENIANNEDRSGAKHLQVLAEITKLRQACCNPKLIDSNIDIPSAKLTTFLEIVDELTANNHRALVFSQFVTHLAIIRKALDEKGISYQYLDGSTPIAKREKSVKDFQNGEGQLFLISLKAGGLGLNLTAADYVVHLDPWWNPAVEDQASDRAHRIGQQRPVTIYRLVAENTIEEKIIQLHETKRDLAESLLEGSDQSAKLSMKELMELIKEGR